MALYAFLQAQSISGKTLACLKKNVAIAQECNELQQLKDKENLKFFDSFGNLKFWANNSVKELPFLAQHRELGKLTRGYLANN